MRGVVSDIFFCLFVSFSDGVDDVMFLSVYCTESFSNVPKEALYLVQTGGEM